MNRNILVVLTSGLLLFLAACATPVEPTPTRTTLVRTPEPTATNAPAPTILVVTPQSSPTAAPARLATETAAAPAPRRVFSSPTKPPLDWAQILVQQVPLSKTAYQHQDTVVTWAGVHGANEYSSYADCSGFMNALLTQADGLSAEDFKNWLGARRPFAKDYYSAITTRRGFVPITQIAEVKPGDIIAIRYLNSAPGDNTGHLLLVTAVPQPRTATKPIENATQQWDVSIIDSSESGHGKDDTRRLPDGSYHDGVGRGVMRLYSDKGGVLVGYTWSDLSDSVYYDGGARPIAIGRLDPAFSLP